MSYRFDTLAIHAGQPNDATTGAVTVPIYQTSTFEQLEPGISRGYVISFLTNAEKFEGLKATIEEMAKSFRGD